jgi:pimeloyl-ACP methyl ester carboxylesterase
VTHAAFVDIEHDGRAITLEYAWVEPARVPGSGAAAPRDAIAVPLVVFLHEGLGSLSMWKDYPQRLCDACRCRGLVYSRAGYGRSTPRRADEHWAVDFMHREAHDVLPRLFARLGVDADARPPWLLGHSDGGSIALIHAAAFPAGVAGVIALAPHIFVEDVSIGSIVAARDAYRDTDLRARLARYHRDPDSAFFGWNDIWLDPAFRDWSIEPLLERLQCPILAVQGENDEYGTLAQVTGIRARVPHSEIVVLADCGHSPQRDQPAALTRAVADFIARQSKARANRGEGS